MVEKRTCPLCGQQLGPDDLKLEPSARFDDGWDVQCRMCGNSSVTSEAALEIRALAESQRADLASWVYEQTLHGRKPPTICSSAYQGQEPAHDYRVNQILETLVPRSVSERLDRILENLAVLTKAPGEATGLNDYGIYACYASSIRQMHFFLGAVAERGWLRQIADDWSAMQITTSGWIRIDELHAVGSRSDQAFVAMWFTDELDSVWDRGLHVGISAAGYRPLRMKELEHNEKICERLLTEIERSGLLVADVTGHRQGVYFEAGYAMGLGIPVIWTCRKDQLEECHFDTRQYNYVVWKTPEELAKALEYRIRATIGEAPR
jgi:nucleoside 2-deoxyribosyltransferase